MARITLQAGVVMLASYLLVTVAALMQVRNDEGLHDIGDYILIRKTRCLPSSLGSFPPSSKFTSIKKFSDKLLARPLKQTSG